MTRIVALVCLVAATACVRHVYPYNHKVRAYEPDTYAAPDAARTPGSLWSDASQYLFEDFRGRRVGDILTVRVEESADSTRDASTALTHDGTVNLSIGSFLSAMSNLVKKNPELDPASLIAATTQNDFSGGGSTARSGAVTAKLPVRIKHALPNGDFYVEGNKVLLLNEEESFLYISGVVRPMDIQPDNSVSSTVLADVELEYTGRGVLSESENQGWFGRILNYLWPF